jgi:hypothetical protein
MAKIEVVFANDQIIKGEELVRAIANHSTTPRQVSTMRLTVANTSQAEVLLAALLLHERGLFDEGAANICAQQLTIAATIPNSQHDVEMFQAALQRDLGIPTGSA